MARRTLDAIIDVLRGNELRREDPVHFHQGPEGQPAACYDERCSSPRLDVGR